MGDVGTAVIAEELGYTQRHVCTLAAAGKIPSAYRLTDESEWRFDLSRVRAWKRKREIKPCPSTSVVASGGSSFSGAARRSGNRRARAIAERLSALSASAARS